MELKKFRRLIKFLSWYPPYLGAGIKVQSVNKDCTRYEVGMKLRFWNRNIYGTHFGGSLYAMCDPFFCFIVYNHLGKEYIVWDKAASIEFLRPGKTEVRAVFESSKEVLEAFKTEVDRKGKSTIWFETTVTDTQGKVIASVKKEVYARVKNK